MILYLPYLKKKKVNLYLPYLKKKEERKLKRKKENLKRKLKRTNLKIEKGNRKNYMKKKQNDTLFTLN